MGKRTPNYLMIFLMLAAAAGATYWVRARPVKVAFSADLQAFPLHLDAWNGVRDDLGADLESALEADDIISRSYQAEDSYDPLGLVVVYRKYGRRGFVHRPEMCYPAGGWQLVKTSYVSVPYDGRNIQAKEVVAEREGQREIIVYWFASGNRIEANYVKQQYWMALDRPRPQKYGWAFIRVNCPVALSDDDTRNEIRRFLQAASAPLVSVLTGRKSTSSNQTTHSLPRVARCRP